MARNPLKTDPTRTTTLRKRFIADMNRRFRKLKAAIRNLIITLDVFGLKERQVFTALTTNIEAEAWRFLSDANKVGNFRLWLQEQIDAGILSVDGQTGEPWTNEFVDSSYRQGLVRAHTDSRALARASGEIADDAFFAGGQDEFLRSAFAAPETVSKLKLIQTRAFETLRGVTAQISADMGRILSDGLAAGLNPEAIARNMAERIDTINVTRARVIARTEIIHAHAEGQLDGFVKLGVQEVGILAEWQTAGDDRVCPQCAAMEGVILKVREARGMIPRHPNCRCAWVPADEDVKLPGQKTTQTQIERSISASIKSERPKATRAEAIRRSRWIGKRKNISKKR